MVQTDPTERAGIISVFGSAAPRPGDETYQQALEAGGLLARAGFAVQTGGYCGVMEAASRGAQEAGGRAIGVTSRQIESWRPEVAANSFLTEEIRHDSLRGRLLHLVERCSGVLVLPGGVGTLAELSLVWNFVQVGEIPPRPIVTVGEQWRQTLAAFLDQRFVPPHQSALVSAAADAPSAVDALRRLLLA